MDPATEYLIQIVLVSFFTATMISIGIFGAMLFLNDYFNKKEKKNDT